MTRTAKLSHTMRNHLSAIVRAGDAGWRGYLGRTNDALERRGLVRWENDPESCVAVRFYATDAGRAALA